MSIQEKPSATASKAIDLSHHLSDSGKRRTVSPLKGLQKYARRPGMINLAGGMYFVSPYDSYPFSSIRSGGSWLGTPDPTYFPFASLTAEALAPDVFSAKPSDSSLFGWFWNIFGASTQKTGRFTIPKYGAHQGDIDLATALQYCKWKLFPFHAQ